MKTFKRFWFGLACLLLLALPTLAAQAQSGGPTTLYIGFVSDPNPPATNGVTLLTPANGAVLDTLLPVLSWQVGTQPAGMKMCMAMSLNPNPTNCSVSFMSPQDWSGNLFGNLSPATTFHWRVGIAPTGTTNYTWSEEWTFTTPPDNGVVLPVPVLSAPASGSTLPAQSLTLSWQPVDGATGYAVLVHNKTLNRFEGTEITSGATSMTRTFNANTEYEWRVRARNAFAWGEYSAYWSFTTAP